MATLRAKPRFIGINKKRDSSELRNQSALDALNVQLDDGTIRKRDGYTSEVDMGASAVLGLYDFRRNDGSVQTLIKHGSELFVREAGANTSLATGLSATELASFAVHSDRAYYVDGTNLKVTDGLLAGTRDAQLTQPGSGSAPVVGSAGVMSGTYDYKVTFYSGTFGQESPASDATITVDVDDEQIDFTAIPVSAQTDVTTRRIYRRKVSTNETLWFFVWEIPNNIDTTWSDNTLDNDVSTNDISPLTYSESLPGFRYLEQHSGVMFLAGDDDKLYFTLPDKPWSVTNFIRVGGEGAIGKITGLRSFHGLLVIFKEDSIWTLSGITENTFNARLILSGVGCAGGHSIVSAGSLLYFMGEDAFYVFNGAEAARLSDSLQPDILARNRSRDKYAVGVHDEENRSVIWTWSGTGASVNDQVSVYFYGNTVRVNSEAESEENEQSWCPWQFNTGLTYCARVTTDATSRDRKVWYGFDDGVVGEPGGNQDGSTAIEFKWQTGKWDGEIPEFEKNWVELHVELIKQSAYTHLEVRHYRDAETDSEQLAVLDPRQAVHDLLVSDYSRDIRLEFYENSVNPVEVVSFTLEAEKAGRA